MRKLGEFDHLGDVVIGGRAMIMGASAIRLLGLAHIGLGLPE